MGMRRGVGIGIGVVRSMRLVHQKTTAFRQAGGRGSAPAPLLLLDGAPVRGLLLLEAAREAEEDAADLGHVPLEGARGGVLAEAGLEDGAEGCGDVVQVAANKAMHVRIDDSMSGRREGDGTHLMRTPQRAKAAQVASNCMPTRTKASLTWESEAWRRDQRRRTSWSCLVRPRRVLTAVGTSLDAEAGREAAVGERGCGWWV